MSALEYTSRLGKKISLGLLLVFPIAVFAQGAAASTTPPAQNLVSLSLNTILLIIVGILFGFIVLLGMMVSNAMGYYKAREKTGNAVKPLATLVLIFASVSIFAQEALPAAPAAAAGNAAPDPWTYLLGVAIIVELAVILLFIRMIYFFTGIRFFAEKENAEKSLWSKINDFKTAEEEAGLDSGHDYDGIRELDNSIPPWWSFAFVISIIFAGAYLYRYHIAHAAPLSIQEYEIAMAEAKKEKDALLKLQANKVDENNVVMSDAAGLAEGRKNYIRSCAACHGQNGEGIVGPNLADNYWIHEGSLPGIFKSIKYGWVEKGMKAWEEDFSPTQIAEIASYVKSLQGTNPPNAKEKQGELYVEKTTASAATGDSSLVMN